jgi:cupin 2 domain-containing protein
MKNIFSGIPDELPDELFEELWKGQGFCLERIVSRGHATVDGVWDSQDWDEWVLLLKGSAGLRFKGEDRERVLRAGDYLLIPIGAQHRVEWTAPDKETVWLALHARSDRADGSVQ